MILIKEPFSFFSFNEKIILKPIIIESKNIINKEIDNSQMKTRNQGIIFLVNKIRKLIKSQREIIKSVGKQIIFVLSVIIDF